MSKVPKYSVKAALLMQERKLLIDPVSLQDQLQEKKAA
jgi:hypothetical protein